MSLSLTLSPLDAKLRQAIIAGQPAEQPVLNEGPGLGELGAEIDAIEKLIHARQQLLGTGTADPASLSRPSINTTQLPDSGDTAVTGTQSGDVSGDIGPVSKWTGYFGHAGLQALRDSIADVTAAMWALVLFAAAGLVWYWRRRSVHAAKPSRYRFDGPFQDTEPVINAGISPEQIDQNIFPPEYGMLEEAEIYLRFGHGKLAEEALKEAIRLNPESRHAYLTLLRLYAAQGDRASFAALAQRLHESGDQSIWAEVSGMGRTLNPGNPLYH
ncbi:MAG TPA: hypothetical protein VGD24_00975 [Gallionella sp.]